MISCIFSCHKCGIKDAVFEVRSRDDTEDIAVWMHDLQKAVGDAHFARSPWCSATEISEVKIPLPPEEGGRIGTPTKH